MKPLTEDEMRQWLIPILRAQGLNPICAEAKAGSGRADLKAGPRLYEFKKDARGKRRAQSAVSQLLSYQTALRVEGEKISQCVLVCWYADVETERFTQKHGVELLVFPTMFPMLKRPMGDTQRGQGQEQEQVKPQVMPMAGREKALPDGEFWWDGFHIYPGAACHFDADYDASTPGRIRFELMVCLPRGITKEVAEELTERALAEALAEVSAKASTDVD